MAYEDTLATRLRMERARIKQTQSQVSTETGIATANICRYELGEIRPSLQTLTRLADYYGVSLDYLVGLD